MSETVHYKGKLIPTGKTLEEYDPTAIDSDDLNEDAVEIKGLIFEVEKEDHQYSDIFTSSKNDDGSINFEVKYYDGGCGFSEAIDYALKD
tara:strand:+ start:131 stop:400 length:270 start_codon:yes stop_codon:yes gene_type:complete